MGKGAVVDLVMTLSLRAIPGGAARADAALADRAAAQRCLEGDRDAFAFLVRRHGAAVFGFCSRMVGPTNAEEIAQESFARAWSRLGEFRWESTFKCWLFRIALNLCRDQLKSGRTREEAAGRVEGVVEPLDLAPDPEGIALGAEAAGQLARAIDRLQPKYREAFVLKHVEELSYEEIRRIVGMPIPALKVRVHRARGMLQRILEEEAEVEP